MARIEIPDREEWVVDIRVPSERFATLRTITREELPALLLKGKITRQMGPDLWTYGYAFFLDMPTGMEARIRSTDFGPSETARSS